MTKEQKLSFYKELLKIVSEHASSSYGLCYHITISMQHWYNINNVELIDAYWEDEFCKNLPELYKFKPPLIDHGVDYWFPSTESGRQQRIEVLNSIIIKMENNDTT